MPAVRDTGRTHQPRRRPRPTATQRARIQQRTYVSQGRAVPRAAAGRRRAVRGPRQTPVQRARSQQHTYVSQGRAVPRAAVQQRRVVRQRRTAARQRYFTHNPVGAAQRKVNRGVLALSQLQAQNPTKYRSNIERSQRSRIEKAVRTTASAGESALKSTGEFLKKRTYASQRATDPLYHAGIGPDPSKAGREIIDIVSNTPSGVYMAAAAAHEAAHGDRSRARKLWKDFKHTSALAPAASALARNAQGKGASKQWKEAAHRAEQRPITTALELSGAKALVGRTGGALLRGAPSKTLRKVGSTSRPNLKLYHPDREGPGPEIQRTYSRDVLNKAAQKYVERRMRKGSRVRRHGEKKGTQRRPGRDPNVDAGTRLVPPNPLNKDRGQAPRPHLRRRIDTRYFAQQRALEGRRSAAVRDANKALKGKDPQRLAVLQTAARADKIRVELKQRLKDSTSAKAQKQLRQMLALPDKKLITAVEDAARPHMGPRTSAKRSYTPEEQTTIVKSLDRRARRGQRLTASQRQAVDAAIGHQIARAVSKRRGTGEIPGAATARAVVAGALRKIPEGERVRAELRPKPATSPRVPGLEAGDFKSYFEGKSRRVGVKPARIEPTESDAALTAMRAGNEDLAPTAVYRAHRQAVTENQRLLGDEFGIGPVHPSKNRAIRYAKDQHPDGDLVPYKQGENEWRLVPREVDKRITEHRKVDESIFGPGSGLDRATNVFKDVVLTTSSPARWLGGNVGDIGVRTLMEGITPLDIVRGGRISKRLDKMGLQGEQARAAATGGGLGTTARATTPGARVGKLNVPRHVWHAWKRGIYGLEHSIEILPQWGAVGKAMRRETSRRMRVPGEEPDTLLRSSPFYEFRNPYSPEHGMHVPAHQAKSWRAEDGYMKTDLRSLLKLHSQQINSYAQKLGTDRAMEARIQKATEDVIGRWGKVSPAMRRSLSMAPFAQWLGAATRYVYVTLPVHHPIKTGVLAGVSQMTEDERVRLGLSYFAPVDKRAPDYQMGALPLWVGQNKYGPTVEGIRTSRMTSLGTAGTTPWNLPEFLMPQISSGLNALRGQSFTGEPLTYPPQAGPSREGLPMDMVDRLPVAAGAQLESMLPFASAFRRSVLEKGRPSEPFSTILTPATRPKFNYDTQKFEERPGSARGGLTEWLTPFATRSRVYTLGAGRDIERSQQTLQQLNKWNARRKRKQDRAQEYGPSPKNDSFWGGGPPHPHTVVRPKQTDEFWK